MEILSKNLSSTVAAYVDNIRENKSSEKPAGNSPKPSAKADRVELSPTIKQMQKAKKIYDSLPDIQEERVEQIRNALLDGTYRIEPERIAAGMIKESLLNQVLS